jgi:hypothetical protein
VRSADFGPSDPANAALICGRHPTTVPTRRLAGRVEWDLTRGSYDQLIARRAAQEPA